MSPTTFAPHCQTSTGHTCGPTAAGDKQDWLRDYLFLIVACTCTLTMCCTSCWIFWIYCVPEPDARIQPEDVKQVKQLAILPDPFATLVYHLVDLILSCYAVLFIGLGCRSMSLWRWIKTVITSHRWGRKCWRHRGLQMKADYHPYGLLVKNCRLWVQAPQNMLGAKTTQLPLTHLPLQTILVHRHQGRN